jgi:uncharacterized damage-inducible protein DinB
MNAQAAVSSLQNMKIFFDTTTKCFEEKDGAFAAAPATFTVAQHIAHTAATVDWFLEGAFRPEGFDMDFAGQEARVRKVAKLSDARAWWERSMAEALRVLRSKSEAELAAPLPEDGIMGGAPRHAIIQGLTDHTAHHRGALSVYARLLGKVPAMPYGG